jgi:vitamin B12 transporter
MIAKKSFILYFKNNRYKKSLVDKLMSLLTIWLILSLIYSNASFGDENNNNYSCRWDNETTLPCLKISSLISNYSKFSKSGINKTVITKKEIESSGAIDLIDIFKSIPDINITQSGPKGQQASIFMNGTGSNHTLVMINGVPINDQSTTQGLHDFGVDFLQTIHQIEIYPGSSASHFGTNAIGGAINIILTGDYKDSFSFAKDMDLNYEFSGNKTFIYDTSSLNIKIGSIKNETISARGDPSDEKDSLKNYSTNINYEKFISDNTRIYNTTYLRQTKTEYDNSNTDQIGYYGDNKMGTLQFGLENQFSKYNNNYILYYNIYDREYDEKGTIDTYESQVFGLKYDFSSLINQKISYGLGSEYKYDWGYFNNNGSYEASTKGHSDNLALYGNLGWNFIQNSNISFFTRNDNHKQTGNNHSYKLNFNHQFTNFNFGVSYMNGLRNPTLFEMFGVDNFGYSGNKNLKPEKSNTYEIYSNIVFNKNLNIYLRAFKANIKNNIEYIGNSYQNDTDNIDLNQSGLNSQINIKFKNTNLNLYSSFLESKKEDNSDQLRRPKKNYGWNVEKKITNSVLGDLNFNLQYNHYGKHFDTHSSNFDTIELDSTDLVDLKISKKFKNSNFFIKISNVLNESYQRPHGYNQERTVIKIGISY